MTTMKIGSLSLTLPSPYFPGHTCTASEAAILNMVLHSRLKKNLRAYLRQPGDDTPYAKGPSLDIKLNNYIRSYSLNGHNILETVAHEIALDLVRHQIKASGRHLRDYAKSALNAEAKKVLEGPKAVEIRALAKRRIAFIEEAAVEELERKHG